MTLSLDMRTSLDRELLGNPFEAFGFPPPKTLMRRPFAEEAAAIHQFVARRRRAVR
jgi:hypothetical protein